METTNKVFMDKIYLIIMLCRDDDIYYTDYVNRIFNDFESAKKCMYECASNEFGNLTDTENNEVFDYVTLDDEIAIYKEGLIITRYSIISVDFDNKGGNDIE